ncbi:MAG: GrpB family protein, partial [Halanaerobium sp.]
MSKLLSEMSLEELWQLFPIILEELNPKYKNWYLIEAKLKKDLEKEYKNNL